jgi:hypothetical protein
MCLCCSTKAKTIRKDVLPGYNLLKGTVGHPEWPLGHYALQRWNDPDFIFKEKPAVNPCAKEKDAENNKKYKAYLIWAVETESMEKCLKNDPEIGYELYRACLKAGWRPKRDGFRLSFWLRDHLGKKMKKRSA